MTRVRSRTYMGQTGFYKDSFNIIHPYDALALSERCDDETVGDNNALFITRKECVGGLIDHNNYPIGFGSCINKQMAIMTGAWTTIQTSFPEEKPAAFYASQAVARTNPSRPYVDVPVNILELGDITMLLKKQGDNLIQQIGGNNLRYQFGIVPLVSDLIKLTRFHEQVARRVAEIGRLKSEKGLRKTITLDSLSVPTKSVIRRINEAAGPNLNGMTHESSSRVIRAHTRWLPTADLSKMPSQELAALAKKAVLGLTVDFSTLWEAVPFSWLVDWGYNVGDFLKAKRNIIPANLSSCTLMTHTRTQIDIPGFVSGATTSGAGSILHESKRRFPVSFVVPGAHFPFLSGNQMGILASLAVTRR